MDGGLFSLSGLVLRRSQAIDGNSQKLAFQKLNRLTSRQAFPILDDRLFSEVLNCRSTK
jgi:hypothetical protein